MLRQVQKLNSKIKSNNYYFYGLLILICYNYYILYNYLLDNNYNILLFFFIYLLLLYSYLNIFSYVIAFITLFILKLLNIDSYIKNIYIIENHECVNARRYVRQRQQAYRRQNPGANTQESQGQTLEQRIQESVDTRANQQRVEAENQEQAPPDPAYDYIIAHMPDCGKEMIALNASNSLPTIPK